MAPSSPRYSKLKGDALSEQSSTYEEEERFGTRRQKWTTTRWIIVLFASFLSTNILTGIVATKVAHSRHRAAFVPPYGVPPFFNNISLDLHSQEIYAPLYDRSHSIYRKHDTPETEVAWRELSQLGPYPIFSLPLICPSHRDANKRLRFWTPPTTKRTSRPSGHRPGKARLLERSRTGPGWVPSPTGSDSPATLPECTTALLVLSLQLHQRIRYAAQECPVSLQEDTRWCVYPLYIVKQTTSSSERKRLTQSFIQTTA